MKTRSFRAVYCPQHRSLGYCKIRKSRSKEGDIVTLFDCIAHADGTKERKPWARVNEATNEILSCNMLGGA